MWKSVLFTIVLLLGLTLPAAAQESPTCDVQGLVNQIGAALAALPTEEADVLDVLGTLGDEIAKARAACGGLTFEGGHAEVIGPMEFPEGIYRARITTDGFAAITITALEGECGAGSGFLMPLLFTVFQEQATNGAEAVFTSTGCEALLEIGNITAPYLLEFERLR
jgi:hypothetical protein